MVTIALLPYLVHNYENTSQLCRDAADRVAQVMPFLLSIIVYLIPFSFILRIFMQVGLRNLLSQPVMVFF